ncbi:MAG: hypothetical protein RLZZ552_1473, partial [Verrucomicrobiota bacterium]
PASDDWSQFVGGRVGAESLKVLLGMSQTRTADVPLAADQKVWESAVASRHPSVSPRHANASRDP